MTTVEMRDRLEKDGHAADAAAEIAAELAAIAAEREMRKSKKAAKGAKKEKKAPRKAARKQAAPKKAKAAAAPRPRKDGPTAGILALLGRRKGGATTAEIHAAFPTTRKSDILTRLARKGLVVHAGPGQWLAAKGGTR